METAATEVYPQVIRDDELMGKKEIEFSFIFSWVNIIRYLNTPFCSYQKSLNQTSIYYCCLCCVVNISS